VDELTARAVRNNTASVLGRVQAGEDITITIKGRPVAILTAVRPARRRWLTRSEFVARLRRDQADAGLRDDLAAVAGETTDELGPIG
jgi:prevent-host-death family protein